MNLWAGPGKEWKLKPFPGDDNFALFFIKPPCLFHRLMRRLMFGFRWTK